MSHKVQNPSNIPRRKSNPGPLGHELSVLTIIPGPLTVEVIAHIIYQLLANNWFKPIQNSM